MSDIWAQIDLEFMTHELIGRTVVEALQTPRHVSFRVQGHEIAELLVAAAPIGDGVTPLGEKLRSLTQQTAPWEGYKCIRCLAPLTAQDCPACGMGVCCCPCEKPASVPVDLDYP